MMTTFHCDKLCSCDTCAPLRSGLANRIHGPLSPQGRDDCPILKAFGGTAIIDACDTMRAVYRATDDPAKLAELYALALRPRGLGDGEHIRITHWVHPVTNKQMIGIWWRRECVNADCDLPTARAKLLAIMQTSPDESSRDACNQILKGEP